MTSSASALTTPEISYKQHHQYKVTQVDHTNQQMNSNSNNSNNNRSNNKDNNNNKSSNDNINDDNNNNNDNKLGFTADTLKGNDAIGSSSSSSKSSTISGSNFG